MLEHEKFRQYTVREDAEADAARLEEAGIPCTISDNLPAFDVFFTYNAAQTLYTLSLLPADFDRAAALIAQWTLVPAQIDEDHYLLTFTIDELYDVLRHPSEWDPMDVQLATRLLRERGHEIKLKDLQQLAAAEKQVKDAPEPLSHLWLINGYLFAFVFGPIGIVIGYLIWGGEKTLSDGTKIFRHGQRERRHGKIIMLLSVVMFLLILALIQIIRLQAQRRYLPY